MRHKPSSVMRRPAFLFVLAGVLVTRVPARREPRPNAPRRIQLKHQAPQTRPSGALSSQERSEKERRVLLRPGAPGAGEHGGEVQAEVRDLGVHQPSGGCDARHAGNGRDRHRPSRRRYLGLEREALRGRRPSEQLGGRRPQPESFLEAFQP